MLHSKKGSAIVIVLIMSVIAMGLTMFSVYVSKEIVKTSSMLMDKLYAKINASSEIEKLKFYISTGKFYSFYVENKGFLDWPDRLYIDGRKQTIDNCSFILQDTGCLINVWSYNSDFIGKILKHKGVRDPRINIIKDSILDWYDRDDFVRVNGAESFYYKEKSCKYTPRNFYGVQSVYEMHLIRGLIDNRTFSYIEDYLTLSPKWNINLDTCSVFMLSSLLNISESMAQSLEKIKNKNNVLTLSDIFNTTGIKLNPKVYNTYPTFVLDIKLEFRFNKAMEKIFGEIGFYPNETSPYRIIEWQN